MPVQVFDVANLCSCAKRKRKVSSLCTTGHTWFLKSISAERCVADLKRFIKNEEEEKTFICLARNGISDVFVIQRKDVNVVCNKRNVSPTKYSILPTIVFSVFSRVMRLRTFLWSQPNMT